MNEGPNIARIGAVLGDPTRAEALSALLADRALTASELAGIAGVTKQTMSAHLTKMLDTGLVLVAPQGRHRYFRLAGADVAQLLESLIGVAQRVRVLAVRTGPADPALRHARVCYDHLAGECGVRAYEALLRRRVIERDSGTLRITAGGREWFRLLGIDTAALSAQRREFCRPCLDWSERREHLAGAVGAALLQRLFELGWAKRRRGSRIVAFSPRGGRAFRNLLDDQST